MSKKKNHRLTEREAAKYGFRWGPADFFRGIHIPGRGRVARVITDHDSIEIYVSEKGRNIRVWRGGKELT